jgi:flagellar biosynthesis anti-sigma factor FlgM
MLEKSFRMEAVSPIGRAVRQTAAPGSTGGSPVAAVRSATLESATPQSDVLAMAEAIASQSPPIDAVRVAALREKIANGDYSIQVAATALAIANALVDPGEI